MAERRERELMLGIFLMEAWDTAGALEEGLDQLTGAEAPAAATLAPLGVLAHRLKGSAALYGFPGVSDLAGAAERLLERAAAASAEERARTAGFLGGLVGLLKEVFDGISAVGVEDAARVGEFKARYPAFLASAPAAARAIGAMPSAPAAGPAPVRSPIAAALDRFFADGNEVLEYFLPEATEHLEAMTTALLAVEGGARDEETLATVFRSVHTLKGAAYTVGCAPIGDAAHQIEDLLGAVRENRLAMTSAVTEAIFVGTTAIKQVLQTGTAVSEEIALALERATQDLRALMASAVGDSPVMAQEDPLTSVAAPEVETVPASPAPPLVPVLPGLVRPEFLARLEALPRPALRSVSAPTGPSIRVAVERLDTLMNLVGELMIARSRLDRRLGQLDQVSQLLLVSRTRLGQVGRDFEFRRHALGMPPRATEAGGPVRDAVGDLRDLSELFAELEFDRYDDVNILARSVAEMSADVGEVQIQHAALLRSIREDTAQVQRLTAALRKEITRARMVPVGRLFTRVAQQVREAARATGKAVALTVRGETAEVDNSVIEQIADPLLHLIQNAIGHGIESTDERERLGKPAQGRLTLSASQAGGFILVEVEDDGRGIDADLLRRRAVERGLLLAGEAAALSDRDALNLIFVTGFSTAAAITRTSGRGVGLDVVRTNVSRLDGEIHVETEPGRSTRFTLKVPLTVAIADALMVRCGPETLAFPLTAVSVMRPVAPSEIVTAGGRDSVRLDDQVLDLVRLDRVLGLKATRPSRRLPVVVLRGGGKPFGVVVDELLGKEEIVIKSLGTLLEGVGPFSGATISGEGRVILLLDPTRLREAAATSPAMPTTTSREEERADEARSRILLVDDSVSIRKFVGQMLEKAGFDVLTAVDGQDAIQQLTEQTVDVVITDLEMPRVNGYALIEDLRRRSTTREVPVIVLTTRAGAKHVGLARRLGVRHYVAKPVEEQSFIRLVASVTSVPEAVLAVAGRSGTMAD
ncbi:MAG TPA: response regulator [Candidatus Dormibacteraeota bacterium]|nr:response regulator [Candidatus Dormibacteraeota bacterium]